MKVIHDVMALLVDETGGGGGKKGGREEREGGMGVVEVRRETVVEADVVKEEEWQLEEMLTTERATDIADDDFNTLL